MKLPSCSCPDFRRVRVVCKHVLAVVEKQGGDYGLLGTSLLNHPWVTLDPKMLVRDGENVVGDIEAVAAVETHAAVPEAEAEPQPGPSTQTTSEPQELPLRGSKLKRSFRNNRSVILWIVNKYLKY